MDAILVLTVVSVMCRYRHRCETVKRTEIDERDKCGNYEKKKEAGYNLNRVKSGLKDYTDSVLTGLMKLWKLDVSSSPMCTFTRYQVSVDERVMEEGRRE